LAFPTTPSQGKQHNTQPTPGLLPCWAPLPALLNRSGCRATISRIQPPGMPPLSASESFCPPRALQLHRSAGSSTARAAVRRGRKPVASARRLPGQRQRQTGSSAAQPPPRGIQAESGCPPGVFRLSGPAAHSAQPHSVATPSHPAGHQTMAPIQTLRHHYVGTRFEEQRQLHLP
jgi:hypothetical protein